MYDATEEQKELLLLLIELKGLQTDRNLYLEPYTRMPNPKDGLVHGSYGQSRQKTRRFSSNNPNRTQLSTKSPIRKVYVPLFKDHVIVSFDEAGQELRHIAHASQDPMMLSCFIGENKKDMHSITGRAIMALKEEDISYEDFIALLHSENEEDIKRVKKHRNPAKTCNFLDAYMGTAPSLAEKLLIPLNEAEAIIDAKHTEFFITEQWKEKMVALHRERKYAVTPLGARKHCILDGSWKDDHELRSALNSIIQGGSAEQIKMVMTKLWKMRITDIFDCVFMFPVHDEILFSCRIDQVVDFCKVVHPIMTAKFADMDMPWESSIEIGWNYGELKEFSGFDEEAIAEYIKELRNGNQ
jgi:DNA polymerase-1